MLLKLFSPKIGVAFFVLFCLASFPGFAETMEGRIVRIVDGDTLILLDADDTQHRVRLSGIDTPERKQPFGNRAKQNISRLTGMQDARLEWYKKNRWQRLIGTVWVVSPDSQCQHKECPKTLDVGMAQLTQGLALGTSNDMLTSSRRRSESGIPLPSMKRGGSEWDYGVIRILYHRGSGGNIRDWSLRLRH